MIKTSEFNQKVNLLTLNHDINLNNISTRNRFIHYMKVRASVSHTAPDKISVNTRTIKCSGDICAIEWRNEIFKVISIKTDKRFCTYTAIV